MVFAPFVRGFFGRGGGFFVKKVGIHENESVSIGNRDPWVSGRGWKMTLMIYHPPPTPGSLNCNFFTMGGGSGYWQTSWLQVKPAFLNLVANLFKIVQQKAGRACNRLNDPFINATTKSLWGGFCNCLKDLQGRGLVNTIVSQNSKYGKVGRRLI